MKNGLSPNRIGLLSILFSTVLVGLLPSLSRAYTVDVDSVRNLTTAGPNCFFTALTVNHLLDVPANTFDENMAALLFLNPAICQTTQQPQPGDIGIQELDRRLQHVFTYLGPNLRFEKAGPAIEQPFQYVEVSSSSAKRFVHCRPMKQWIVNTMSKGSPQQVSLDQDLSRLEQLSDLRSGETTEAGYSEMQKILDRVEGEKSQASTELMAQLTALLQSRGVLNVPFPGFLNSDYYQFGSHHPELLQDPEVFGLMWLSARLQSAKNYYIYSRMK